MELGTHHGFSYLSFCQAAERSGLDARGYAVDTWRGDEHAGFYDDEVYTWLRDRHDPRYGGFSRLVRSTFDEALPHFAENSIDLLHIDGRHFYEDVKHDFESWKNKLSDRAIVLLHDTNVRERGFGVFRLWEELREQYPAFEFLHGHGLGVLGIGTELPEPVNQLFAAAPDAGRSARMREIYARLGSAIEERYLLAGQTTALRQREEELAQICQQGERAEQRLLEQSAYIAELERATAEREHALTLQRVKWTELERIADERLHEIAVLKAESVFLRTAKQDAEHQLAEARMLIGDMQKRSASSRWLLRVMAGKVVHAPRDISRRWRKSWRKRHGPTASDVAAAKKRAFDFGQLRHSRYRKYLTSRMALSAKRVLPRSFVDRMQKRMDKNSFTSNRNTDYQAWIAEHDTLSDVDRALIRKHIGSFATRPKFSVLMPVYNTPERYLLEAIDSVRRQLYEDWELCIVDDASTAKHIRPIIEKYSRADGRIKPVFRPANGGISAASNDALAIASGNWVVLADHDDVLAEHSLYMTAEALNREPDAAIIYSDEDQIDEQGRRSNPYFKPDWSYDLFLSQNLISHQGAYRADLARQVNGFREKFEGSQDWDFALRILDVITTETIHHIPAILYHWRQTASSFSNTWLTRARHAACQAVNDHLVRTKQSAVAIPQGSSSYVRVKRQLPEARPLVSIVIPTKDQYRLLKTCIDGITLRTTYSPMEIIIVNNGSSESNAINFLNRLKYRSDVKILDDPSPFNYSRLINQGVAASTGEICVLLNNDVDVINPDWLDELTSHAIRPDVGAVGAKLYYANDTLQHGGVILGAGGIAGHAHRSAPRTSGGYLNRLNLTHNLSCVTAACLAYAKASMSKWEASTRKTWLSRSMTSISV